eukprot:scaffold38449_cov20-Tisochrysis_lutea.AAC.2
MGPVNVQIYEVQMHALSQEKEWQAGVVHGNPNWTKFWGDSVPNCGLWIGEKGGTRVAFGTAIMASANQGKKHFIILCNPSKKEKELQFFPERNLLGTGKLWKEAKAAMNDVQEAELRFGGNERSYNRNVSVFLLCMALLPRSHARAVESALWRCRGTHMPRQKHSQKKQFLCARTTSTST